MQLTLHSQIELYIKKLPQGSVISISDFATIAKPKTISKNLERLCNDKKIEKVIRGIFWKPDNIHSSPNEDDVANAIARLNRWEIVPSGSTALHKLGFTKNKPEKWTYVTNGTYRSYSYDGKTISFQHTTGKWISSLSKTTALLVQGIKAYGNDHIPEDIKKLIANKYQTSEINKILIETKDITSWIAKSINLIFSNKSKNVIAGDE